MVFAAQLCDRGDLLSLLFFSKPAENTPRNEIFSHVLLILETVNFNRILHGAIFQKISFRSFYPVFQQKGEKKRKEVITFVKHFLFDKFDRIPESSFVQRYTDSTRVFRGDSKRDSKRHATSMLIQGAMYQYQYTCNIHVRTLRNNTVHNRVRYLSSAIKKLRGKKKEKEKQ